MRPLPAREDCPSPYCTRRLNSSTSCYKSSFRLHGPHPYAAGPTFMVTAGTTPFVMLRIWESSTLRLNHTGMEDSRPSGVFRDRRRTWVQVRALKLVIFITGPGYRSPTRTPRLAQAAGWTYQFTVNDLAECRRRIPPGTDLNPALGTNKVVPSAEEARPFSDRRHLPPTRTARQRGTVVRGNALPGIPSDDRRTP